MNKLIDLVLTVSISFLSVFAQNKTPKTKETLVLFTTTIGPIKVKLYDETPKHRDNFIKLVKEHSYDSLLFHRVISEFMIQGGDPDSKHAAQGTMLGNGGLNYTIPAEIMPAKYYHKKGALAAARMGDDVNPNKESSSCQFYIVQGKTFSADDLGRLKKSKLQMAKQEAFNKFIALPANETLKNKFVRLQTEQKMDSLTLLGQSIDPLIIDLVNKTGPPALSDDAIKTYTTIGGAPHLDGGYTVFGEVVEGLDTVDKIAAVEKDQNDRPLQDVRIIAATIVDK